MISKALWIKLCKSITIRKPHSQKFDLFFQYRCIYSRFKSWFDEEVNASLTDVLFGDQYSLLSAAAQFFKLASALL